jgi:hypothetical protein
LSDGKGVHILNNPTDPVGTPTVYDNGNNLALIWGQTLRLFDIYPIFKDPLVWFELVNEPYDVKDFIYYQSTIEQIRTSGTFYNMNDHYTNKIVMGISTYSDGGGHVVTNYNLNNPSNPNRYYHGISQYNGQFPYGDNLCITLHQYFNSTGSGRNYTGGEIMIPHWSNFESYGLENDINQELLDIVNNPKLSSFDFIVGEFGYDQRFSPGDGGDAVVALLDAMVNCNNTKGFTQNSLSKFDYLNNTKGGLWLGFAAWQINPSQENYAENNAATLWSIYANYFS